jgi:hypothetical protein
MLIFILNYLNKIPLGESFGDLVGEFKLLLRELLIYPWIDLFYSILIAYFEFIAGEKLDPDFIFIAGT